MLSMTVLGRVANERPYTDPTITWRVRLDYTPVQPDKAPVSGVFNVPCGPGYASGPGADVAHVFAHLQELADDEWLDVDELAAALRDYDETATPAQVADSLEDARALAALGATIGETLRPILEAMGIADD